MTFSIENFKFSILEFSAPIKKMQYFDKLSAINSYFIMAINNYYLIKIINVFKTKLDWPVQLANNLWSNIAFTKNWFDIRLDQTQSKPIERSLSKSYCSNP